MQQPGPAQRPQEQTQPAPSPAHVCLIAPTCSCSARHCSLSLISAGIAPPKVSAEVGAGQRAERSAGCVRVGLDTATEGRSTNGRGFHIAKSLAPAAAAYRSAPSVACRSTGSITEGMASTKCRYVQQQLVIFQVNGTGQKGLHGAQAQVGSQGRPSCRLSAGGPCRRQLGVGCCAARAVARHPPATGPAAAAAWSASSAAPPAAPPAHRRPGRPCGPCVNRVVGEAELWAMHAPRPARVSLPNEQFALPSQACAAASRVIHLSPAPVVDARVGAVNDQVEQQRLPQASQHPVAAAAVDVAAGQQAQASSGRLWWVTRVQTQPSCSACAATVQRSAAGLAVNICARQPQTAQLRIE